MARPRKPLWWYAYSIVCPIEEDLNRHLTDEEVYEEARYRLHHVIPYWDDEESIKYATKECKKILRMGERRGITSDVPIEETVGAFSLMDKDEDGNYISRVKDKEM